MYMRDERRKKEASKVKQPTRAKQHSTPKAVTFPKKNELPQVGLVRRYTHVHVGACCPNLCRAAPRAGFQDLHMVGFFLTVPSPLGEHNM